MTDVWAPTPGRPYVTDTYSQAVGITNTLALPDNTKGPTYGFRRDGAHYISDYGGDPLGAVDSTVAVQAAIDAASATSGTQGRVIVDGLFLVSGQIKMRVGCVIEGQGPNFYSRINWVYTGSDIPLVCDGVNGSGGYLFNAGIRGVTLIFTSWTPSGGTLPMTRIKNAYSVYFDEVVWYTNNSGHTANYAIEITGGSANEIRFNRCRRDGTPAITRCLSVDSDSGNVLGLSVNDCRWERCSRGINVAGTTGYLDMTVIANYWESNSACIYWETTSATATGTVLGGSYIIPNASSDGIVLIGDGLTVIGGNFYNAGGAQYSINLASTRPTRSKYLGPTPAVAPNDPFNDLGEGLTGSSLALNPADQVTGTSTIIATITVTGAALGDRVTAAFSLDLQGMSLSAYVSATNTVKVVLTNLTGGNINLLAGDLRVKVSKP